jgi:hypothetical protein
MVHEPSGGAPGPVLVKSLAAGPAGPVPTLTVQGIEVTQCVQDLAHSAPLIAGKRTTVRVYLTTSGPGPVTVRGTVSARTAGVGGWTPIPSSTEVILNPADSGAVGLRRKRELLGLSLNFLLPPTLTAVGPVEIALTGVERVDLLTGTLAETLPPGFAISDTAFRIFILMAGRRIKSDRFLTDDYTPEVYTPAGIDWVEGNGMREVLLRHEPSLGPVLADVRNCFFPWPKSVS